MGRRLTRKQIKHDEFVTLVDRGLHWMGENWRRAATGFAMAIGLAVVWWGITAILGSRAGGAARALDHALEIYQAPLGATAPAGAELSFATETERLDATEAALKRVTSRYWLTPQVRLAKLYLARVAIDRGDAEAGLSVLRELASRRSEELVVRMAMLDVVHLRLARSEGHLVAQDLEAMVAGTDPRLPRDVAMFLLAEVRQQEGKADEATALYRKVAEDFPDSPYRYEAQQRLTAAS